MFIDLELNREWIGFGVDSVLRVFVFVNELSVFFLCFRKVVYVFGGFGSSESCRGAWLFRLGDIYGVGELFF